MVKADWVSVAASLYKAVTDPTKTPPIYQVQCVHSGASCLFLASNRCIVRIEHSGNTEPVSTAAYRISNINSIGESSSNGSIKGGLYKNNDNPLVEADAGVVERILIGFERFCWCEPQTVSADILTTFDTVLTHNGKLFTINRSSKKASWIRCDDDTENVIAAADVLLPFFNSDMKADYDIGFVVGSENIVVSVIKHKTLPITAFVPLIYIVGEFDLSFRTNTGEYSVTGFGDKEKPYLYKELKEKGENKMEGLPTLTALSQQLGLKENINNVPVTETKPSFVTPQVAEAVVAQQAKEQLEAPAPVVETPTVNAVEKEEHVVAETQQEPTEQPKQLTAIEMLQELAEEIDSLINLNNTIVKQWPKKVKAINKAFAAEAKARALDPKVAKRLEELEADSAKLKKILSTLGM